LQKRSRVGCPEWYEAFAEELTPLVEAMHKGVQHVGKVPAGARVSAEIAALERKLEQAVAAQRFEEAARLRDLVRDLKAGKGAGVKEERKG